MDSPMDSESPPPAKRARRETLEDENVSHPQRGEPWYEDGNIILQADHTHFRVFRGVLAASSEIFADMLLMPQPAENKEDSVAGDCPTVQLTDSAVDWSHVLKALFERKYIKAGIGALPLPVVSAFLRLGNKYEIPNIRNDAVDSLTQYFPSTLRGWDQSETGRMVDVRLRAEVFQVIELAQQNDLPQILPAAFLRAVMGQHAFHQIVKGCHTRDLFGHIVLSHENQETCLIGWHRILKMQVEATFSWIDDSFICSSCILEPEVFENRIQILDEIRPTPQYCHPLDPWNNTWNSMLCKRCQKTSQTSHKDSRKVAWAKLPSMFNLQEWEKMKAR